MKIQANSPVEALDGSPLVDDRGENQTLGDMVMLALLAPPVDESAKLDCFKLAQKFAGHPETVELTLEDATLAKKQSEKYLSTVAYGRVVEALEG